MIEIMHLHTKAVVYRSETATTIKESVIEAVASSANLRSADLQYADLRSANLQSADLQSANLQYANLQYADLRSADLRSANLQSANLQSATEIPPIAAAQTIVAAEGDLIAWKKCENSVIVKLRIPHEAKRSNATGRKCRAEFADVLEVIGAAEGISQHNRKTKYVVGQRVACDGWCEDRWQECAGGIHFFITRAEAEDY